MYCSKCGKEIGIPPLPVICSIFFLMTGIAVGRVYYFILISAQNFYLHF